MSDICLTLFNLALRKGQLRFSYKYFSVGVETGGVHKEERGVLRCPVLV